MPFPMQTGYQREEQVPAVDPMTAASEAGMESPEAQSETMNAQSYGPSAGRTGADVIAAALAQPTLRTGDPKAQQVGTTGFQGEMDYGADPSYGV